MSAASISGAAAPGAAAHRRIKALFDEVADLPGDAACRQRLAELGANEAEQAEVMALVAQDRSAVTHLSAPLAAAMTGAAGPELKPGERLGAWLLEQELGQGGMGHVFAARRADGLYEQRAAIKLLRGQPGEAALAQLARERRILAGLSHPHIARLLDGGTTPLGRPYLVMEYVAGQRIDTWCAAAALPLQARLALFAQVAEAVAYAHRQLVVHCDLKPGNVLVGEDGRAMLLDFGIAQLQGLDGNDTGSLTPAYASPEQRAGRPASAASDVYGLGRLLDELLGAAPDAAARADEWRAIVARATRPEPPDRYPSVEALLADLGRFRAHEPLQACPPSWHYRGAKLLRRRWPVLTAAAAALAVSVAFVLQLAAERDRAEAARAEAQAQAAAAAQASDFLVSLFEGADPRKGGHPETPVRTLVDKGRASVDGQLREQPALQATMKGALARVYENLGQPSDAMALYEQAVALESRPGLNRPLALADLLSRQAIVLANSDRYAQALAPAQRSLELRLAHAPSGSLELADSLNTLGWVQARNVRFDAARENLEKSLQIRVAQLGPQHLDVAGTMHNLGLMEWRADRPRPAERWFKEALAIKRAQLPPHHANLLSTLQQYVALLGQEQRFEEALPLAEQLVAGRRQSIGPDNRLTAYAEHELAVLQRDTGRTEEALANYRRSMATAIRYEGARTLSEAVSLNNIGGALMGLGDPAAEAAFRDSLAIRQERLKPGDPAIARAQWALARWLLAQAEAQAQAQAQALGGPPATGVEARARQDAAAARLTEAGALATQADAARSAKLPATHRDRIDSLLQLAQWSLASGQVQAAADRLAALPIPVDQLATAQRVEHDHLLGRLRQAQGRLPEAVAALAAARDLFQQKYGERHPDLARRQVALAQTQWLAGDAAAARAGLQAAQPLLERHHADSPVRAEAAALSRRLPARP